MAELVHKALVPKVKETLLGLPRPLLFDERVVRTVPCLPCQSAQRTQTGPQSDRHSDR